MVEGNESETEGKVKVRLNVSCGKGVSTIGIHNQEIGER